jgi:hypothetical protein
MPHSRIINSDKFGPARASLLRARLHIKSGKRRLSQGKISLGILTLYDALNSAMQWFIAVPENRKKLLVREEDNLNNDKTVFMILVRSGILDRNFDYDALDKLVDEALKQDMSHYDYTEMLKGIEYVMTKLGVMPFDEDELRAEESEID